MIRGDREDLIWLAGILEGEGCFDLHRGRYPRVRVAMVDRDIVGRVASLIGSSIRLSMRTDGHKATFHAEISGAQAALVMEHLLPFMGARRSSKIAEILGRYALLQGASRATIPGPSLTRPPGFHPPVAV